ncbi:acyl-CoA--sterol O-acyltransferase 1-like [Euphorbia lathyris]|uniref:acyl-CoA--sterol O-acyltransferase 1-like n=1 Tax=Euphorbia lathyris TaxID=212925 RepID=UPI0033131CDE
MIKTPISTETSVSEFWIRAEQSRNQDPFSKMELEGEFFNFIKVWILIFLSLSYCYSIGKIIPKGSTRLFFLLPIICLFVLLPLNLHSIHLGGMTGFFISWLANFKLLLYAFGLGPLSSHPSISLIRFLLLACFPIKIQQNPSQKSHLYPQNEENSSQKSHPNGKNEETPSQNSQNKKYPIPQKCQKSYFPNYTVIKFILLFILIRVYNYREFIHPKAILVLYSLHMYIFLELGLAILAVLARAVMGFELEPQFNEPYRSASLQDFWGRRWNIMVTSILRPTVYEPLLRIVSPAIGRRWAPLPALMGTFVVSAIMHELIFYYLGRVKPTWEISFFFLLHGVCLVVEVALKKVVNGRWWFPVWITAPLTIGFVLVTCFWMFFPTFLRCKADLRALDEYVAVAAFVKKWWSNGVN